MIWIEKTALVLGMAATAGLALRARTSCEQLPALKLPGVEIVSAKTIAAGKLPGGYGGAPPVEVPARCVVEGIARPSAGSAMRLEGWMPAEGWNGRYRQQGNGAWAARYSAGGSATSTW
jgi:feruloyl esterase